MKKFILVSCTEREINVEGIFDSFDKAVKEMLNQFEDCCVTSEYDDENNYSINKKYYSASAWCISKNDDNCDWKVIKITI